MGHGKARVMSEQLQGLPQAGFCEHARKLCQKQSLTLADFSTEVTTSWTRDNAHLCVWVVAPPVWSNASLASQVPHLELDVLVCDGLHIEANGCKRNTSFNITNALLSLRSPSLHGKLAVTVSISWVSLADVTKIEAHLG